MRSARKNLVKGTLGICFLLSSSLLVSWGRLPIEGEDGFSLQLAYTYKMPVGWTGDLRALLDANSHFLYVAESGRGQFHIRKIDWRRGETVLEKDYSTWTCHSDLLTRWELVSRGRYIHLWYCSSQFVLDMENLSVVRELKAKRSGEGFLFPPPGGVILVSQYDESKGKFAEGLYSVENWTKIADWENPGFAFAFTPDGRYLITRWTRPGKRAGWAGECGVNHYDVRTLKLAGTWSVNPEEGHCLGSSPALIPGTEYYVVDRVLGRGLVVRNLWDGKILYDLPSDLQPKWQPSVSPDGRLVVAGAWDDPEDSPWSRDFIIWDLGKREIVYQTPRYRSVWGRNTTGREVFPQFSYDGEYLIVAKEKSVEIWQLVRDEPH
jgi:hypothetical protein